MDITGLFLLSGIRQAADTVSQSLDLLLCKMGMNQLREILIRARNINWQIPRLHWLNGILLITKVREDR